MKKKKLFKLIFIVSFMPYVLLLLYALYKSIVGYDIYTWILPVYKGTIYGIEAFMQVLIWNGIALCFIPVLPACFLYQIIYLIIRYVKKRPIDACSSITLEQENKSGHEE